MLTEKTIICLFKDDAVCKDYLDIIDVGTKSVLYRNCSEIAVPTQILSLSNELQVIWICIL